MPTLVLERTKYEEQNTYMPSISEQEHNARISRNYAAIIDPSKKIDEILNRRQPVVEASEPATDYAPINMPEPVQAPVYEQSTAPVFTPELVTGARADADIFRADSEVNRHLFAPVQDVEEESTEEENEDLKPTPTTIQYRTLGVKEDVEASRKIENKPAATRQVHLNLSKRDKIIVAVVVSVVVALFVLIIINSAVLSGLNRDVTSLQSSLTTVKGAFEGIKDEISPYLNISEQELNDFAILKGWVKIG